VMIVGLTETLLRGGAVQFVPTSSDLLPMVVASAISIQRMRAV